LRDYPEDFWPALQHSLNLQGSAVKPDQKAANILIDWRAEGKNQVTFPLGIGVGRTFKINPSLPPIQMSLEFQWMPVYPESFGQRFNIRYVFKPVLPSLIKKPLFQ
jgi:hypothetical protein